VTTPLGEHLRARRAQVSPEALRLPSTGVRRVPGLRREEVAFLAGVSVDYYVRLEQGRERHPSAQVLDAIAGVLEPGGDPDFRLHLYRLAGLTPEPPASTPERVDPQLLELMTGWPDQPALVLGRAYDVLAANQLGRALLAVEAGDNLMEKVFLTPTARSFYRDWERVAADSVAGFRLLHGRTPDDPRTLEVLARLQESAEFAALWERHDARGKRIETKRFSHPEVGDLTLRMQAFDVRAAPGQELVVYHAEPGSASAEGLRLLGSLAATEARA
jgi:transcriptional regulator with XRE-family HTH domain